VRKLFVVFVVLSAPFQSASSCGNNDRMCTPHAIRQDLSRPGRYWVCNDDGNAEKPIDAPVSPSNHNWG
jgi:hypothetical protein